MIKELKESTDELLALEFEGRIDENDYKQIHTMVEKVTANTGDPLLLLDVHDLEGITPAALCERIRDQDDFNQFAKVAMVGDKAWQEMIVKVFGTLMKPAARFFEPEERQQALQWLKN